MGDYDLSGKDRKVVEGVRRVSLEAVHPAALEVVLFMSDLLRNESFTSGGNIADIGYRIREVLSLNNGALHEHYNRDLRPRLVELGMPSTKLIYVDSLMNAK